MKFGQLIYKTRLAAGLTQEELASRVGCSDVYISQIEKKDNPKYPTVQFIEKLCNVLGLDPVSTIELALKESKPELHRVLQGFKIKSGAELDIYTHEQKEYIGKMLDILNTDNKDAIASVKGLIDMLHKSIIQTPEKVQK